MHSPNRLHRVEARVLIVEDEALIALHLEQLVTDAGHRVIGIALDPSEARDLARSECPHFAFVDVRLRRGASGLEVARFLREEYDVPSIFVTGNLDEDLIAQATALRPVEFIGKPFFPSEVVHAIETALEATSKERLIGLERTLAACSCRQGGET